MAGKKFKYNKIIIGTFAGWKDNKRLPVNGMIEPLISYFGPKSNKLIIIDCPHPGSDTTSTVVETYFKNDLKESKKQHLIFPSDYLLEKFNSEIKTQPLFKIRDFLSSIIILFSQKRKTDVFIGLESIHTLAGIIARRFNKVKKVVYYVSDYSPNRYKSVLFNKIYLFLDRYCSSNADVIWDVSPAMMPARIISGFNEKKIKKHIIVPNALFPWQIKYKKINEVTPYSIVFAGTIGKINGLDLAIEAFAEAKKKLPDLRFHILGGGVKKDERRVKQLIEKYNLQKSVENHGFVSDLKEITEIVSSCMVGIAPYRAIPGSIRWYADATKIRLYFAAGVPVITTHVPPLALEAKKANAAIVCKDSKKELSDEIVRIFTDKKLYEVMRNNAIEFAKNNTWNNTYSRAAKSL